jgi:uncharacterized repeat protein (TIGR02543 family)
MRNEELQMKNDAQSSTALSRVHDKSQHGKSPQKGRCNEESKLAFLIPLFSFLIFLACHDPLSPSQPENIPTGKGSFSLSVSVARTILPDTPTEFASYTLVFEPSSGSTKVETERSHDQLSDPVYLDTGTYELVVTAFIDENKPAARGSETITINAGLSTSKEVKLRAIIENNVKGDFTYTVFFPAGLVTAGLTVTPLNATTGSPEHNANFLSGGDTGTATDTRTLNTGYYNVVVTLIKNNGNTLIWRELLHVYANLESVLDMEFTDADFYKTKYTVTFIDGSTELINLRQDNVLHGTTVTEPDDPTKDSYTFGGWYSDEAFSTEYDFSAAVIGNITLYAKWDEIPVSGVTLNKTSTSIFVGSTETLTYTVSPSNATNQNVTWESSDEDVATVSNAGLVTAVGIGTATITATSNADSSVTASCAVTVSNVAVTNITGVPTAATAGTALILNVTVVPNNATNKTISWSLVSVGTTGATISGSTLNTTGPGTVTIRATIAGGLANGGNYTQIFEITVTCTVTFNSNGGGAVASQTVGGGGTASKPRTPAYPGQAFLGWYSNSGLTVLYNFGTTVTGNITLYAKWRAMTADEKTDFGADATIHDIFTVANTEEWNAAVSAISDGGNDKNYAIDVIGNFDVASVTTATFGDATGIKVSLRGSRTLTISIPNTTDRGNLIRIAADQTVILRDLTLQGLSGTNNDTCLVYMRGVNSAFTMHSGKITGNTNYLSTSAGGVFVYTSGTFTMYGGEISGNKAADGGGVSVSGGTFTMNGGTISGNTAGSRGGGVYVGIDGTFTMNGGTISGNTASGSNGGGVRVADHGMFIMGRDVKSTSDVDLPKISGNNSYYEGGGVYVLGSTGTFHIVNGIIYGSNVADTSLRNTTTYGQDMAFYNSSKGTAQRGTFSGTGGAWVSKGDLVAAVNAGTIDTIKVVNGDLIATTEEDKADFGAGEAIHGTFNVSTLAEWNAAKTAITDGGNAKNYIINVTGNFDVEGATTATFGSVTGITVSLRGDKTMTLSGTGSLLRTAAGQTVILRGPSLQGSGTNNASLVYVTGAGSAFTMQSGKISGNTSSSSGGGVYVSMGTFTMHGGTISGNTASTYGGGVSLSSGTFDMYSGEISVNTASQGGGVWVNTGTFTMYGGTISGNTASTYGGGVYNGGTFRIVTGTIYGSNEAVTSLKNTATTSGAALSISNNSTTQRGTFNGVTWVPATGGDLATNNNTIKVLNGAIVP